MVKAAKSCHQVTWAQKSVTKKRVNQSNFLISKSLNVNSQLSCINLVLRCAVSSGICPKQIFCPYQNHIDKIPLKFIALVCLKSLLPMYFVVQSKEGLKLKIVFPHLLLQWQLILKSLLVSLNFLFRKKQVNFNNLTFCFLGTFFWAPIPVNRYEIHSQYGPGFNTLCTLNRLVINYIGFSFRFIKA